ncbi:MAG: response regulator transcription factor [Anaerolineaceae bacterium]|nr:MAG: response regulator transcription factor [Anaerolineaceae bacterium]
MTETEYAPIRIVIAEDHAVVRQALRVMLEMEPDVTVVGEAVDGEEAAKLTEEHNPDLVVLDVRMEGMDGVAATRKIRDQNPETAILILTGFGDEDILVNAVEAGAHGFLLKDATHEELLDAIRRLVKGESLITPSLLRRLLDEFVHRHEEPQPAHNQLTPRETEVLQALARGLRNEEIARELVISEKTVKTHLTNIFGKLQVEGRSQAIIYAIRHGLVDV